MISIINPLELSWSNWGLIVFLAVITGMSKNGLKGMAMVTIPIFAAIFGGKASTGILLPLLIFGDLFAIFTYRGATQWKHIRRLFPWAIIGIFGALIVGEMINDKQFRHIIAISILACLAIIIYNDFFRKGPLLFSNRWFSSILGLSGGFATMMGNAAGPIFNLYLLSMRLPKVSFIGTGAWFYLTLNLIKVPLHYFVWETITPTTLQFNFILLPMVAIGAWIGKKIVNLIPEKAYRYFVLTVISITSALLFFK